MVTALNCRRPSRPASGGGRPGGGVGMGGEEDSRMGRRAFPGTGFFTPCASFPAKEYTSEALLDKIVHSWFGKAFRTNVVEH